MSQGFIGFDNFHSVDSYDSLPKARNISFSPIYNGSNSKVSQYLKSLSKKDVKTKQKSLKNLFNLVEKTELKPKELRDIFIVFGYYFHKILFENDKLCRILALSLFNLFSTKVEKFFKNLAKDYDTAIIYIDYLYFYIEKQQNFSKLVQHLLQELFKDEMFLGEFSAKVKFYISKEAAKKFLHEKTDKINLEERRNRFILLSVKIINTCFNKKLLNSEEERLWVKKFLHDQKQLNAILKLSTCPSVTVKKEMLALINSLICEGSITISPEVYTTVNKMFVQADNLLLKNMLATLIILLTKDSEEYFKHNSFEKSFLPTFFFWFSSASIMSKDKQDKELVKITTLLPHEIFLKNNFISIFLSRVEIVNLDFGICLMMFHFFFSLPEGEIESSTQLLLTQYEVALNQALKENSITTDQLEDISGVQKLVWRTDQGKSWMKPNLTRSRQYNLSFGIYFVASIESLSDAQIKDFLGVFFRAAAIQTEVVPDLVQSVSFVMTKLESACKSIIQEFGDGFLFLLLEESVLTEKTFEFEEDNENILKFSFNNFNEIHGFKIAKIEFLVLLRKKVGLKLKENSAENVAYCLTLIRPFLFLLQSKEVRVKNCFSEVILTLFCGLLKIPLFHGDGENRNDLYRIRDKIVFLIERMKDERVLEKIVEKFIASRIRILSHLFGVEFGTDIETNQEILFWEPMNALRTVKLVLDHADNREGTMLDICSEMVLGHPIQITAKNTALEILFLFKASLASDEKQLSSIEVYSLCSLFIRVHIGEEYIFSSVIKIFMADTAVDLLVNCYVDDPDYINFDQFIMLLKLVCDLREKQLVFEDGLSSIMLSKISDENFAIKVAAEFQGLPVAADGYFYFFLRFLPIFYPKLREYNFHLLCDELLDSNEEALELLKTSIYSSRNSNLYAVFLRYLTGKIKSANSFFEISIIDEASIPTINQPSEVENKLIEHDYKVGEKVSVLFSNQTFPGKILKVEGSALIVEIKGKNIPVSHQKVQRIFSKSDRVLYKRDGTEYRAVVAAVHTEDASSFPYYSILMSENREVQTTGDRLWPDEASFEEVDLGIKDLVDLNERLAKARADRDVKLSMKLMKLIPKFKDKPQVSTQDEDLKNQKKARAVENDEFSSLKRAVLSEQKQVKVTTKHAEPTVKPDDIVLRSIFDKEDEFVPALNLVRRLLPDEILDLPEDIKAELWLLSTALIACLCNKNLVSDPNVVKEVTCLLDNLCSYPSLLGEFSEDHIASFERGLSYLLRRFGNEPPSMAVLHLLVFLCKEFNLQNSFREEIRGIFAQQEKGLVSVVEIGDLIPYYNPEMFLAKIYKIGSEFFEIFKSSVNISLQTNTFILLLNVVRSSFEKKHFLALLGLLRAILTVEDNLT
eukprot:snap_masked-scaffold_155-processed-gene-0.2-mRNA-1 protein AED:1.00 eAED:1.00 QI:0/-1/0/0/-1/1/1/0/1373